MKEEPRHVQVNLILYSLDGHIVIFFDGWAPIEQEYNQSCYMTSMHHA